MGVSGVRLDVVTELRSLAGERAAKSESDRRLAEEVVIATVEAGFARHFVPRRWGGDAGTFREFLSAVTIVGEGCASAAWCAALYATLGRMTAHLPPAGQERVWGAGPDTRIVGAITPSGAVTSVDGGWRLSGEWPFTSAANFSDWALAAGVVPGRQGGLRYFAVPREAYTIGDTWSNVGMRGTGSNTVVLDDVFVPEHLSFAGERLWRGSGADSPAPCHNVAHKAVNGLSFVAPALGAVRAAIEHWSAVIAKKTEITGRATKDKVTVQLALARSAAETDAAGLLLERAADAADAGVTPFVLVRNSRDYAIAMDLLVTAVDRIFRAGGARGQGEDSPVQRAWRDVTCAAGHVALQFEANGTSYASHVLAELTT
jgi:two-component flavin-dependent monooxygenase